MAINYKTSDFAAEVLSATNNKGEDLAVSTVEPPTEDFAFPGPKCCNTFLTSVKKKNSFHNGWSQKCLLSQFVNVCCFR